MNRTTMRELAFKLIYSLEIQKDSNTEELTKTYIENNDIKKWTSSKIYTRCKKIKKK